MNLQRVRYLGLVLEHGSFSAAGRAAGVSQPAISQAMRALEGELDMKLFERVGRELIPTAAARRLVSRSEPVHGMIERLRPGKRHSTPTVLPAVLRVGLAPAAGLLYMHAIEDAVHAAVPDGLVAFEAADAGDMLDALRRGDLDCVAAPQPRRFSAKGLERHFLHGSEPRIYARVGHPLAQATSLDDLREARWVVSGRSGSAGHAIDVACRVRRLPAPRVVATCTDYWTLIALVARSDLLAVVPHRALLPPNKSELVQALEIREGLPTYEVHLFWPKQPPPERAAAIRAAVDALTALQPDLHRLGHPAGD